MTPSGPKMNLRIAPAMAPIRLKINPKSAKKIITTRIIISMFDSFTIASSFLRNYIFIAYA